MEVSSSSNSRIINFNSRSNYAVPEQASISNNNISFQKRDSNLPPSSEVKNAKKNFLMRAVPILSFLGQAALKVIQVASLTLAAGAAIVGAAAGAIVGAGYGIGAYCYYRNNSPDDKFSDVLLKGIKAGASLGVRVGEKAANKFTALPFEVAAKLVEKSTGRAEHAERVRNANAPLLTINKIEAMHRNGQFKKIENGAALIWEGVREICGGKVDASTSGIINAT